MPILRDFSYHAPKSLKEALALLKRPRCILLAGGTIVLNTLKKTPKGPERVVSLRRIAALAAAKETKDVLSLGAAMTISEVERLPAVTKEFPSLCEACRRMATTPLRNMATIGGNIASRFFWADLPAVLMSLEARLVLETSAGRKEMSVDSFVAGKTKGPFILSAVGLPWERRISFYLRHTRTMPVDIPTMAVAFSAAKKAGRLAEVRFVLNSGVAVPMRLKKTENVFEGCPAADVKRAELRTALAADTAGLRLDDYKRACLQNDAEEIVVRLTTSER